MPSVLGLLSILLVYILYCYLFNRLFILLLLLALSFLISK